MRHKTACYTHDRHAHAWSVITWCTVNFLSCPFGMSPNPLGKKKNCTQLSNSNSPPLHLYTPHMLQYCCLPKSFLNIIPCYTSPTLIILIILPAPAFCWLPYTSDVVAHFHFSSFLSPISGPSVVFYALLNTSSNCCLCTFSSNIISFLSHRPNPGFHFYARH